MDREDRGARKHREAEGEGVSRAGGKREGASRPGARARRRGKGRGRSARAGAPGGGGAGKRERRREVPARTGRLAPARDGERRGESATLSSWKGSGAARALTRTKDLGALGLKTP